MRKIISLISLCACLLLSACGFHLRKPSDFPENLRTIYLVTDNVSNAITSELKRELRAAHVNLTSSASDAPITLKLQNSQTQTNMPVMFDSTAASSYSYILSVNVELTAKNHTIILNAPLSVMQSVTYNVNQTGTPAFTPLMRNTLTQQLVDSIYNLLTSHDIQRAIAQLPGKH